MNNVSDDFYGQIIALARKMKKKEEEDNGNSRSFPRSNRGDEKKS